MRKITAMPHTVGWLIGVLVLWVGSALAQPTCLTVHAWPASESEEMFEQAARFTVQDDKVALARLLLSGRVFILKVGLPVYLEESKLFKGTVKIRAPGDTASAWTAREAVKCGK